MKHVFKFGGPWKRGDIDYTIKAVDESCIDDHLDDGWFLTLDAAIATGQQGESDDGDDGDDVESDNDESSEDKKARLAKEIEALGGTPPKSGSVAKFEQKLLQVKSKA